MEQNKKETTFMIECEDCKAKIKGASINHKKEFKINGQSIFLTYYDCPDCGKRHFVQIDDTNSLKELEQVKNEFVRLANKRKSGKKVSQKQSDNFKKTRQHLADYRMNLMKEFTGKIIVSEMGIEYVLRFSV